MTQDKSQAVLAAAVAWIAEIAKTHPEDFAVASPGGPVSVVISDVAGERPRVSLFIGDTCFGRAELLRKNPSLAN
jgi:hypothetical protein